MTIREDSTIAMESFNRTITRKCLETGKEFELKQTKFGELWFPDIKYCDEVLERMEQEYKEENARQIEEQRRELGDAWIQKNIPPIYHGKPDRSFPINWRSHDKALATNQSMLLIGGTRKGKTRTAMELMKREAYKGMHPEFRTAERMAGSLGEAMGKSRSTHQRLIDHFIQVKMLVIDDLGKENVTERVQSDMFEIFNARFEYKRLTVITTNWKGDALISRYPDKELAKPLIERFREFCEPIMF